MLRAIFFLTLLSLLPRRVVYAWAPEARMTVREFGAFVDSDDMFEIRSPPNQGQVLLPTFNPLHRSHKMVAPLHTSSTVETKHLQEPRNHLPGYSDPEMMKALQNAKALLDNNVMKLFYNKKNLLPDTADVFGRDEDTDVRTRLDELEEDLDDDFQPPTDDMEFHTKRIYFEPRHKLPDKHYGSEI